MADKSKLGAGARKLIDDILEKDAGTLVEHEIALLKARSEYLTDAQKEEYLTEAPVEYTDMTNKELIALIEERGIEMPEDAKVKVDYVAVLEKADEEAK